MNDFFSKEFDDNIDNIVDNILEKSEKSLTPEKIEEKIFFSNLLVNYLRKIGRNPEDDYSDVVPISFELLENDVKIKILEECSKKDITIEKSKIYNSFLEGAYDGNLKDIEKVK